MLKQLALASAALGLGINRTPAQAIPLLNDNLRICMDWLPVNTYDRGIWFSECADNNGTTCTLPIWKEFLSAHPILNFANDNYCGNTNGFSASGGRSDLVAYGLFGTPTYPIGRLYKLSYTGQIVSSISDNDQIHFLHNKGPRGLNRLLDVMNRTSGANGRSDRSVLIIAESDSTICVRAVKANGANPNMRFRADNLQITELPPPALHIENHSATHLLAWWDKVYGQEQNGTWLLESPLPPNINWDINTDGVNVDVDDGLGNYIGYGKTIPKQNGPRLFKLRAQGTPEILL